MMVKYSKKWTVEQHLRQMVYRRLFRQPVETFYNDMLNSIMFNKSAYGLTDDSVKQALRHLVNRFEAK